MSKHFVNEILFESTLLHIIFTFNRLTLTYCPALVPSHHWKNLDLEGPEQARNTSLNTEEDSLFPPNIWSALN